MLLGASSTDQLMENIGAIQVSGACQPCGPWTEFRVSARHLSSMYLLSTYYIPGTVRGTWATAMKNNKSLAFEELAFYLGKQKTENARSKIRMCVRG